jgi:hypothetical protein
MASKSSLPIALGLAGVGSLYLISGIQNKSLGSIFNGDLGITEGPESTPSEDAINSQINSSLLTNANSYPGHQAAANPLTVGNAAVKKTRAQELQYGLTQGLKYKTQLEGWVRSGVMTQGEANQKFQKAYPWYSTWAKELKALI